MASSPEEKQRTARRRRLAKGLLIGAAAVGLPALANAWVRRRAGRLEAPAWGRIRRYSWKHGEIAFQQLGAAGTVGSAGTAPLVLLHSFGPGHDSTEWQRASEILAETRRVFVPDLLGWGRSDKPSLTYDGELYNQLLQDFLEDVVREPAVLVGSGLSAAYAVQVGFDRPQAVRALGLVCPLGLALHAEDPDLKDAVLHRLMRLPVLGTAALNLYTSRSNIRQHLRSEMYAAPERIDASMVEHHYRASHEPGSHSSLAAYIAGYLNHDVSAILPRLSRPVWLAWGRRSQAPPVEDSDRWLQHLPEAELEVLEGLGNVPHGEQPAEFCRTFEAFLDDLPESPGRLPEAALPSHS